MSVNTKYTNPEECQKDEQLCNLYDDLLAVFVDCFPENIPDDPKAIHGCAEKITSKLEAFKLAFPDKFSPELSQKAAAIHEFTLKPSGSNYRAAYDALIEILVYLKELGQCNCGKDDDLGLNKETLLQSPHLYLQAAGSKGVDSAKGIHLRWVLKGGLENRLPKGNYAIPDQKYNWEDDFVKIYRAPYREIKSALDLNQKPDRFDDLNTYWIYLSEGKMFYLNFNDKAKYAEIRETIDPSANYREFITAYGDQELEIDLKTELAFSVSMHFSSESASASVKLELRSVEKNEITAKKRVTLRKSGGAADFSKQKLLSENIRSVRFRSKGASLKKIEFEFYTDFVTDSELRNQWTFIGKHALTKDSDLAFQRLEPSPGIVHGNWLRYNEDAFVNVKNYKTRWNSPELEPENRMLNVIETYIKLSNNPEDQRAIERVYYNEELKDQSLDSESDGTAGYFDLSNLYVLQLASLDYHIARMLGLGILDVDKEVVKGKYMYLAVYTSHCPLSVKSTTFRRVKHMYCSLPTGLSDERLPLPVDLKTPVLGIFQAQGTDTPRLLTDEDGYSLDGKTRFISLFHKPLPVEEANAPFFASDLEFESEKQTIPVFAGIEYRSDHHKGLWQKPELSHDRNYFNIDQSVSQNQTNETRPIVIPEVGFPVFVHRERNDGLHEYGSYGINWFSRAVRSKKIRQIRTTIRPTNLLQPPSKLNAVLIRKEEPLLLTAADEQIAFEAIPDEQDKTFIRLTFEYNYAQELIDYHKEIDGVLINGYAELPDEKELLADDFELFFRNEIPKSISGKIVSVESTDGLLAKVTTGPYELKNGDQVEQVFVPEKIAFDIQDNFLGSSLSVNGLNYIIDAIDNTGDHPVFTIYKNQESDHPLPPNEALFLVVENMLSRDSWGKFMPMGFRVNIDLKTLHREEMILKIDNEPVQTHVQKFRGVYEPAFIEKIAEEQEDGEVLHQGLYKLTFSSFTLSEHSQAGNSGHRVVWNKGVVRIHTGKSPQGQRKELQVVRTEHIGTSDPLILYVVDPTFESDPTYDSIAAAEPNQPENNTFIQTVNYYPGYKVYLYQDEAAGLNEQNLLPEPGEHLRYSIFGVRSRDANLEFVSRISQPVLMFAQSIAEPKQPEQPQGELYATRPDFFGKASYTFSTQFKPTPYSVQFARASDIQLLNALWRSDEPEDASVWTVQRIKEEIFGNGEALWYMERWQNLFEFSPTDENFKSFPNESGAEVALPLPNKEQFMNGINQFVVEHNNFIDQYNRTHDTDYAHAAPLTAIQSLNQEVIRVSELKIKLLVSDFLKDALYNCFVPLTQIPVIYEHIRGIDYSPIPKKQVIRNRAGELLKPEDPDFDMAPMMKVIAENKVQFTDFGIDGASNASYLYISREFSLSMKAGPYSSILGPVHLINTAPPKAPELVKIVPILENKNLAIKPAIEIQINAYANNQNIKKINIYRTGKMQDAFTVRTMKLVKAIDVEELPGEPIWSVKDDFSDLDFVPYGDPLFYALTVSREVKYTSNGMAVVEYQPSEASKMTLTNIVENHNPESPVLSYNPEPVPGQLELESVVLNWNKTVHHGTYYVYKKNETGNWVKIKELLATPSDSTIELPLADTQLEHDSLTLVDQEGKNKYHFFKIIAKNYAGMLSTEEQILTIGSK